jgi:hypothetical protein
VNGIGESTCQPFLHNIIIAACIWGYVRFSFFFTEPGLNLLDVMIAIMNRGYIYVLVDAKTEILNIFSFPNKCFA